MIASIFWPCVAVAIIIAAGAIFGVLAKPLSRWRAARQLAREEGARWSASVSTAQATAGWALVELKRQTSDATPINLRAVSAVFPRAMRLAPAQWSEPRAVAGGHARVRLPVVDAATRRLAPGRDLKRARPFAFGGYLNPSAKDSLTVSFFAFLASDPSRKSESGASFFVEVEEITPARRVIRLNVKSGPIASPVEQTQPAPVDGDAMEPEVSRAA